MGRKRMIIAFPNTVIGHLPKTERWSTDDYAKLLILYKHGLSDKEIAAQMGRTVLSVSSRLYDMRKKFMHMRSFRGWSGADRLAITLSSGDTGCRFHEKCETCPFPACTYDGFDPNYSPSYQYKTPHIWTKKELEHWHELSFIDLDNRTLANIFRISVADIELMQEHKARTVYEV